MSSVVRSVGQSTTLDGSAQPHAPSQSTSIDLSAYSSAFSDGVLVPFPDNDSDAPMILDALDADMLFSLPPSDTFESTLSHGPGTSLDDSASDDKFLVELKDDPYRVDLLDIYLGLAHVQDFSYDFAYPSDTRDLCEDEAVYDSMLPEATNPSRILDAQDENHHGAPAQSFDFYYPHGLDLPAPLVPTFSTKAETPLLPIQPGQSVARINDDPNALVSNPSVMSFDGDDFGVGLDYKSHPRYRDVCGYSDCLKFLPCGSSERERHIDAHPYYWECPTCSHIYTRRDALFRHIKKQHGLVVQALDNCRRLRDPPPVKVEVTREHLIHALRQEAQKKGRLENHHSMDHVSL